MSNKTIQTLAAITDDGQFERLATAILRESDSSYRSLIHPGVNSAGKTVKSPLDGICFVRGANPPHMIAVHHTTTKPDDLEKKWLHDPSKVKPRKGSIPTAPAGDVLKTAEIATDERKRTPDLLATLILTTNEEPSEALVRTVEAEGRSRGLVIDIWSRSRLAHFLDNYAVGQWLRHSFLGIEQELLSAELLYELSKKSLAEHSLPDNPDTWISRNQDIMLAACQNQSMTFIVANSGMGKSVACYRRLKEHIASGGFGLVLSHEAVSTSITLERAIIATLQQLHPSLTTIGISISSLCSLEKPLLVVVEDISRSGQVDLVLEKLVKWFYTPKEKDNDVSSFLRLLCPLWPESLASVGKQTINRIDPFIVTIGGFCGNEGRDAVLARAQIHGLALSPLKAEEVSQALGDDPLLIALHDLKSDPDSQHVIGQFIETSFSRVALQSKENPTADFRQAMRSLVGEMLARRQMELYWLDISNWLALKGEPLRLISRLAHDGELIRFTGTSDKQRLAFRHDRVCQWLLADAAAEMARQDILEDNIVADPFFAEIMGDVLVNGQPSSDFTLRVAKLNPLALFCAIRLYGHAEVAPHTAILQGVTAWLDNPISHNESNRHLNWEALKILSETDYIGIPQLVEKFKTRDLNGMLAKLRNGDLSGGIELCIHMEPGIGAPWRDKQIEHAKLLYGSSLTNALDSILRNTDLSDLTRIGALRLAGHIAAPTLAEAIEVCWNSDDKRNDHLDDYLWAFAECCEEKDAAHFLRPVCDAWAALPDQVDEDNGPSAKDDLAAHELKWAFQKWPPNAAIEYFIQRAAQDDLRWQITYMLHGMDHPKAVLFVVQEIANTQQRLEGTNSFSSFAMSAKDDWRRMAEDNGRPMSKSTRELLLGLWQDENNDKHLRKQAFSFWTTTHEVHDIAVLRSAKHCEILGDSILRERLVRGDKEAIPSMIRKLTETNNSSYWWYSGRHVWSDELTAVLDECLAMIKQRPDRAWGKSFDLDHIAAEMIMRLPEIEAERLLLKHWDYLQVSPYFFQAALYVSTPQLLSAVQNTVANCPEPAKLFVHLTMHFGVIVKGHPGVTRDSQILALAPYLHFLSSSDILILWDVCNKNGWFKIRRELLDARLDDSHQRFKWQAEIADTQFDKLITDNRLHWIDHWIDDFIKTGVLWEEILAPMADWMNRRNTVEAFKIVTAAIQHRGTRKDLNVFKGYENTDDLEIRALINDTKFAVQRRSMS